MNLDDVIDTALLNGIPAQPQVQCSTRDQLKALEVLANRFGLYDAAGVVQRWVEKVGRDAGEGKAITLTDEQKRALTTGR
jgi:hypothetical protein